MPCTIGNDGERLVLDGHDDRRLPVDGICSIGQDRDGVGGGIRLLDDIFTARHSGPYRQIDLHIAA